MLWGGPVMEVVDRQHLVKEAIPVRSVRGGALSHFHLPCLDRSPIPPGRLAHHDVGGIDAGNEATGRTRREQGEGNAWAKANFEDAVVRLDVEQFHSEMIHPGILHRHVVANEPTAEACRKSELPTQGGALALLTAYLPRSHFVTSHRTSP